MAQPAPTAQEPRQGAGPTGRKLEDVPGWFWPIDQQLFGWLLDRQSDLGITGDLLELGPYLGRSAILIGWHVRQGETFTVVDIFEDEAPDASNTNEVARSYGTRLTRARFEANYLDFHAQLPVIIQAPRVTWPMGEFRPEAVASCTSTPPTCTTTSWSTRRSPKRPSDRAGSWSSMTIASPTPPAWPRRPGVPS